MSITDYTAAPGAALPETDMLPLAEQQAQSCAGNRVLSTPAPAYAAWRHFPYARIDRSTIRRTRRLGPALSPSTTRQVYPDEDSSTKAAS
jgi:hypothetical protein